MVNTQYQYQYLQEAEDNTQYQYQYCQEAKVNTQYKYQYWAQGQYVNTNTRYCWPLIPMDGRISIKVDKHHFQMYVHSGFLAQFEAETGNF